MALLTIPSVSKGTPATITLNKTDLFNIAVVAGDTYFSNQENVDSALIRFKSTVSNQRKVLAFDIAQAQPTATFLASAKARGDFEIESIVLVDYDGGTLTIEQANIPSGNTITFVIMVP